MRSLDDGIKKRICLAAGCILAFAFVLAVFGWRNIDPSNTDWVTGGGGDNLQHYIGWRFFREWRWTRYVLFMRNLGYPVGTSVIVTDSNPLFCLFFKIFRNILPDQFQFNGIWILCSWLLLAYFAGQSGWKLTRSVPLTLCGTVISILNPVILQRALIHDTLTAHWLILAALLLFLNDESKWNLPGWFVLTGITLLIHAYFIPMIAFIFCLQLVRMLLRRAPFVKILAAVLTAVGALVMGYFALGYAYIQPESGSYGELSLNLNAFINPDGASGILPSLPTLSLQYEGFNYWGLGLLVLVLSALLIGFRSCVKKSLPYLVPVILLVMLAASHQAYFGLTPVYSVDLPGKLHSLLSVFRASGRLVWPLYYLALFGALRVLSQNFRNRRVMLCLAAACMLIQGADLFGSCKDAFIHFRNPGALAELPPELEALLPEGTFHLYVSDGDAKASDALALFAVDHHLTYNRIAGARSVKKVYGGDVAELDLISCDMLEPDAVYIYLEGDSPEDLSRCEQVTITDISSWKIVIPEE